MAKQVTEPVPVWRFLVMVLGLVALACMLVWRTLHLQVLDADRGRDFLQGQGNARTIRTEQIPAHRGMITDRNGEPLAVSTPVASIWADPKELVNAMGRVPELAQLLGLNRQELREKIERVAGRRFVYLRRHLTPAEAEKVLSAGIPGVYMQREYRRYYPAGEVVAHLVGFTNIDDRGQEGLELAYDEWLRGTPGSKRVLKDLYGNIIRDLDDGRAASPGNDLQLTIDLRLQYLAYKELKLALQRSQAKAGSVVMIDSKTGEVLAMANQPGYNPNNRSELRLAALRNRAVTDVFEPGSTVKPFTVVAALESGKFTAESTIDTNPGHMRIGAKTLVDPVNYGELDMEGMLRKSSQVGISKLSLALNEQWVWDVFQRIGLGRSTGIGFPGESNGLLPNRPKWLPIERANFAFGYGLSVTALQLAQAYGVLANGGVLQPVSLIQRAQAAESYRVIEEPVARSVSAMLESVVRPGGTGTRARINAYRVAGKTGTVHKIGEGGYADDRYLSLFVGMAPATNPRVVTVVTIDEPGSGKYYGGEAAAPVFSRVTGEAMRLLNIAPDAVEEMVAEKAKNKKPGSA
ncbi:cell division protein FtsI (penicillin-binding protein 3) [Litorivivens lipolytica]|uniref:Peptidoglycan D,D-transpeptidase FtsI n=1 Tax=Litorivivens lipolytica TaxID=1524264 RepID=A0A7W4W4M3_9GAMM|nr:penicillin-binding transpeptidase domain-containing protein [Litorivivens lipolytica]MBB3047083.1 cell division protein FtsI (penicillin-binding protein 3) [Litorivivens lipolytica]